MVGIDYRRPACWQCANFHGVVCRKVAFILEELGLTYESIYLDLQKGEHKAPEFTKYNPNGRIPAIIDHANNDFALW
jgi:glutathione S-transferase